MRRTISVAMMAPLAAARIPAQPPAAHPAYEIASVRLNKSGSENSSSNGTKGPDGEEDFDAATSRLRRPQLGRTVVDQTGIGCVYDFKLRWSNPDQTSKDGDVDAPPAFSPRSKRVLAYICTAKKFMSRSSWSTM